MSKINPFKWEKMPLFIGKAVALQRGNFGDICDLYATKALFYALETRNWAQMNAMSQGVRLKLVPASYNKQKTI